MRKVKFIVPIPDVRYYDWQATVQINNFRKLGYEEDTNYLIIYFGNEPSPEIQKIANSPLVKAKFHFYKDEREFTQYTPGMKPWLMFKYFQEFPEEKEHAYYYADPDQIFLDKFNFEPYLNDDITYGSDVGSYINSGYINQKGDGLLQEMCDFVGISKELVLSNDGNCIGAQTLTKNNTAEFWYTVYEKSNKLYDYLQTRKDHYFKPEMIDWLQIWTTEMWMSIWELWLRGEQTKSTKDWEFHWANHMMRDKQHVIYHGAGVTENDGKHFSKIHYQSSPFNKEILCSEDSLSYLYKLEVLETQEYYKDLIWD